MSAALPVTVVVPTWRGGAIWRRAARAITALDPPPERVLVIDSGSDDGTRETAIEAGFDVVDIDRSRFDHGRTRREAVERCASALVSFLSQDAVPEPGFLGALVTAFDDPRTQGATARILPHETSSPLARRTVLAAATAGSLPLVADLRGRRFEDVPPRERRALCLFDDVASMARRSALLRHPFPDTTMGEDVCFARAVLEAGGRLRFVPEAVVRHAHEYGPAGAYRRYRDDARLLARVLGWRVRPHLGSVVRGLAGEVVRDGLYLLRERPPGALREALRSPPLRAAQVWGQWVGSRRGGAE